MNRRVYQGEIYTCDLWGSLGSEEGKQRPCLIIQNDKGNSVSPTTIVLPISKKKKKYPFQYSLYKKDYDFFDCEENTVLCEQIRCIDLSRVVRYLGKISDEDYNEIYERCYENCKKLEINLDNVSF